MVFNGSIFKMICFLGLILSTTSLQISSRLSAFSNLGLQSHPFAEILLEFIQQNSDNKEVLQSKLSTLTSSLLEALSTPKSSDLCETQSSVFEEIIKTSETRIENTQKEIENIYALLEDAKTYVPEKEQEVEQAKRWSQVASREIDLEKTRFLEKNSDLDTNIQACDKALDILQSSTATNLIQKSKVSSELLQISESNLHPAVHALITLASQHKTGNLEKIKTLIENLKEDLLLARIETIKNHEAALSGAQAYSEEKYYTHYNLNRQLNLILDSQIKLQEELYHKQLEIESHSNRISAANKKKTLLDKLCSLEQEKNRLQHAEQLEEVKIGENLIQLVNNDGFLEYINKI